MIRHSFLYSAISTSFWMLITATATALDYPQWSTLVPEVAPQSIVFSNHGTITLSSLADMSPGYPQYFAYSGLDNVPPPLDSTMPSFRFNASGVCTWSFDFDPPLSGQDMVIISDVDLLESGTMDAFDPSGQPLDVSGWSLVQFDPRLPDAGFAGSVALESNRVTFVGISADTSDETSVLQPQGSQMVGRLVFSFAMSGRSDGATVTFANTAQISSDSLIILPNNAEPGDPVVIRGTLAQGTNGFRLFWDQNGLMQCLGTAPASPDNSFEFTITVPEHATPGAGRIGVAGESSLDLPSLWADFRVLPPTPATIAGAINDADGVPVPAGTQVRLRDHTGAVIAQVSTIAGGQFEFSGLPGGSYIVEPLADDYPPQTASVSAGGLQNVNFVAIDPGSFQIPQVYLMRAGAIALPGGSYTGSQPVHVGDWTDQPFTRLVSLQGKGRPPLNVRFYAELKRGLLETNAPIAAYFALRRADGSLVNSHGTLTPTVVYPTSPHNFTAFTWDVNSLELPPGKLTLEIKAYTTLLVTVGEWSFPVEVEGLGDRWFSPWVKNPQLQITQKSFYELQHTYKATLPNWPGVSTPIFSSDLDLNFTTVHNSLDLHVDVNESMTTYGGWSADANLTPTLTLFDLNLSYLFGGSRWFTPKGPNLPACTYTLPVWSLPMPDPVSIPVYTAGLPIDINLCGMKFAGGLSVYVQLSGNISLGSSIPKDLRLTGQLTPALNIGLPATADLELGVCGGSVTVNPNATISAPIVVDPAANPAVDWGLCLTLAANVDASLNCCDLVNVHPNIDLFDPIHIGDCPAAQSLSAVSVNEQPQVPPRHASVAIGPLGYAVAVWDNVVMEGTAPHRTAPLWSVFDGSVWSDPVPIAGDEFAGWDPQVAFIGPGRVMVTWVHYRPGDPTLAGPGAQGLAPASICDDVGGAIQGFLCGGLGFVSDIVGAVGDFFDWLPADGTQAGFTTVGIAWQAPQAVIRDNTFDFRPVLAGNSDTGEAVLIWLRQQEALPNQRPLALYSADFGVGVAGAWSAPALLDAASAAMDIQPSVRFDRSGTPAVAWIRDEDADLGTSEDRRLLYSVRGRAGWSTPETVVGPAEAPWTPSLDFDTANQPVIAFVIPRFDERTQRHWPADGTLGMVELARHSESGSWSFVGKRERGEHPILRIAQNNTATVFFRGFGSSATRIGSGEISALVADLDPQMPDWHLAPFTRNRQNNWRLAADIDPVTSSPIALWETRDPLQPDAPPVMQLERRAFAFDLAFSEEGLSFSNRYANPGESIEISAHLVNLGLQPFRNGFVEVYFYDGPPDEVGSPFAMTYFEGSLDAIPSPANSVTVSYAVRDHSRHTFYAVVDPADLFDENDENNNIIRANAGGLPPPEAFSVSPLPRAKGMLLSWRTASTDDTIRHWIWRSSADGPWELIGSTTSTEFTDISALPAVQYTYRIATGDPLGEQSEAAISAVVDLPPFDSSSLAQDLRLNIISYGGAMHLMWNIVPGVRLETTDRLEPDARWTAPVGEIREIGGAASYSHPPEPGNRFFRLAL